MENLNKQQLILLTLLITFVTSIATGIVTVSLMDQAPKNVTQTINRVVERTIEKVVPTKVDGNQTQQTTIKETVVVKEDDKVTSTIAENSGAVLRVYRFVPNIVEQYFMCLGVVVSADGLIAVPITADVGNGDEKFLVMSSKGDIMSTKKLPIAPNARFFFLRVDTGDKTKTVNIPTAKLSNKDLSLGQTVVSISGEKRDIISTGIAASFIPQLQKVAVASTTASTTDIVDKQFNFIETGMSNILSGAPLLDLYSNLMGMKVSGENMFAPSGLITYEMQVALSKEKATASN